MHYRSISDLNETIYRNAAKLPRDIDLVIGIPRSGLLAANILSLALDVPMADLDGFIEGRILSTGHTRRKAASGKDPAGFEHVLVVDDSIMSGASMRMAKEKMAALGPSQRVTFCAVYGLTDRSDLADVVLEAVPGPRIFQWNLMHHPVLERCCFDIDGVLCLDPTKAQNDDGALYVAFLKEARSHALPSRRIGHLVTSRLEKYRAETEAWLARHGVEYGKLWMLDLPSAEERRRLGMHARFKADVYRRTDTLLFVESEDQQAVEIAELSGKPVLSFNSQTIIYPGRQAELLEMFQKVGRRMQLRRAVEHAPRLVRRLTGRLLR